jgi:hypothetical protein
MRSCKENNAFPGDASVPDSVMLNIRRSATKGNQKMNKSLVAKH